MNINSIKADLIFILVPLAILLGLGIYGFDGMAGWDSYAYVDYATAIKKWFTQGVPPGHLSGHRIFAFLGASLTIGPSSIPLTMQLISCLSLSFILFDAPQVIETGISILRSDQSVCLSDNIRNVCPAFFRQGMVTTSDMLACLMVSLSIYFWYQFSLKLEFRYLMYTAMTVFWHVYQVSDDIGFCHPWILYLVFLWVTTVEENLASYHFMCPDMFHLRIQFI